MMQAHEIPPSKGPATVLASEIRATTPVLETERLRLRALYIEDFPTLLEISTGPRSGGIGGPWSRVDAWLHFAVMQTTWSWRGHGWWTITDRATGDVLGFTGIGFEPGDREPELGFFVTEAAEGRGYAFEAARAVQAFARDRLGFSTLVSYINRDNTRSVALALRLGATRDLDAEAALGADEAFVFRHALGGKLS